MRHKFFFIVISFVLLNTHGLKSQSTIFIDDFFEDVFKVQAVYRIELPYKYKVKKIIIKRSEVPPFAAYSFKPKKRKIDLHLSLTVLKTEEKAYIDLLKDEGASITHEGDIQVIKLERRSNSAEKILYVLLLKKILINSNFETLEMLVTGNSSIIDENISKIIQSFNESSISR